MKLSSLITMLLFFVLPCFAGEGTFPAWYESTTHLNVRASDNAKSQSLTILAPHTQIQVDYMTANNWAAIDYQGQRAYVSGRYVRYVRDVEPSVSEHKTAKTEGQGLWSWVLTIGGWIVGIIIFRAVAIYVLGIIGKVMYVAYWVLCIPFYILNWLQRWLAKPWGAFYKSNSGNDRRNAELRETYEWAKWPLYVLLTPLRFVNAAYYNIVVHCTFELYDYTVEVIFPSNDNEGADDYIRLILLLPWRVLRYVVWHGGLTLIESIIWTVVDTFVPALTLFHGTTQQASTTITNGGRDGYACNMTGVWNVGGGNYAGNGIYFAPARSTALHYSKGSMIVCRVSLGRVLDLGLAPYNIYKQCGNPNALGATKWGLNNGYVTGEWWRKDAGWWEYCMYDWQNRYNHSWRIRPLYVLNLDEKYMQRVPGGMCHWLFRKMVIKDILTYWEKL